MGRKGEPPPIKGKGKTANWLRDHLDYPHDYCLIWPFSKDSRVGRGMMAINGQHGWAHRFMCELAHGPAPEGKPQAAHNCGNGHKGCVNPRHLSWKSNSENQIDRVRHDRVKRYEKRIGFTPYQINEIRAQYASGNFTQMQLAERFGCSLGTIQYYLKYRETRGHENGPLVLAR
jgi:hypothetical protein